EVVNREREPPDVIGDVRAPGRAGQIERLPGQIARAGVLLAVDPKRLRERLPVSVLHQKRLDGEAEADAVRVEVAGDLLDDTECPGEEWRGLSSADARRLLVGDRRGARARFPGDPRDARRGRIEIADHPIPGDEAVPAATNDLLAQLVERRG